MTRWRVTFEDEVGKRRSYVVDAASEAEAELLGAVAANHDSSWNSQPMLKSAEAWTSAPSTRSDGVRRTKIARSTSGHCRICRGPHVYKHGRP